MNGRMAAYTVLQPRHLVNKPPELELLFTHRHSTIMQVCSLWLVLLSHAVAYGQLLHGYCAFVRT